MKQGNNHSSLLDSLTNAASSVKKTDIPNDIMKMLQDVQPQPTLRDVLAGIKTGLTKSAQFNSEMGDPAMDPAMDSAPPDIDPVDENAETVGGSGAQELIAKALVEICGGPEEAKMCIDNCCGAGGGGEMPGPMDDTGGLLETGSEPPIEESIGEVSAEMPMPMPMG